MIRIAAVLATAILLVLSQGSPGFAQSATGTLTGVVTDRTKALLPGVTVTVKSEDTGVKQSMLTNDSGAYSFTVTLGKSYTVTVEFTGFRTSTILHVPASEATHVDVVMEIGETCIDCGGWITQLLPPLDFTGTGATIGENPLYALPFLGADPIALIETLPGYHASPLGHQYDTIGGLPLRTMNTSRDGGIATAGLYGFGAGSSTTLNRETISEMKLFLMTMDPEQGRGNGQVAVTGRSGTNRHSFDVRSSLRNSALDALGPDPARQPAPFSSAFQYTASAGGPIRKNYSFYFVNWDQQIRTTRPTGLATTPVLTDLARNGVFRFWDGWNSGSSSALPSGGSWPIDPGGIAVSPRFRADSVTTPYTGALQCFSVFGAIKQDGTPFTANDCGTYIPNVYGGSGNPGDPANYISDWANPKPAIAILSATPWDNFGRTPDRTGYIQRLLGYMPHPNSYAAGAGADGLNMATFESVRRLRGVDSESAFSGALFGAGTVFDQTPVSYRALNGRIDQNIGNRNRMSLSFSVQKDRNDSSNLPPVWPGGMSAENVRMPHFWTVNAISTLSASMVNEARVGTTYNRSVASAPWDEEWREPNNQQPAAVYYSPRAGALDFSNNVIAAADSALNAPGACVRTSGPALNGCETGGNLFQAADTFSWNHGSHSLRGGFELRFTRAWEVQSSAIPVAAAGPSEDTVSPLASIAAFPELSGRLQGAATNSADLLYLLSGSVATVSQPFWVNSLDHFVNGSWETWNTGEGRKIRRTVRNEFALFIKDDFRVGRRLNLLFGLRYEDYGNPYTAGFATGIEDEGFGLFGASRMRGKENPFDYWLTPGANFVTGYGLTAPPINVTTNVTGGLLSNGNPSYIPGNCGILAANCVAPGGPDTQAIPGSSPNVATSTVACVFGVQQSPMLPASTCDPSLLTTRVFVGPGSNHPKTPPLYRDRNNFGPYAGFSLRVPVFDRTVLVRGGMQMTYDSATFDHSLGTGVGAQLNDIHGLDWTLASCSSTASCLGADTGRALTLADLPNVAPLSASAVPTIGSGVNAAAGLRALAVQEWGSQRAVSATAYAPDYRDPYTTNLSLSVSVNLTRQTRVGLDYAGVLGRKRPTAIDLNTPDVYYNPELLDALVRTRAGEDAPLFDAMLAGLNLSGLATANGYGNIGTCVSPSAGVAPGPGGGAGNCPADAYYQSGSAHLRRSPEFQADLANGNFAAVAARLAKLDASAFGAGSVVNGSADWRGVLKGAAVRNGCDRLANATASNPTDRISGSLTAGNTGVVRCFPEDYIIANPALDAAVYKAGWGFTNYHHVQAQLLTQTGYSIFQATYIVSRLLALPRDFYRTNTAATDPAVGVSFGSVSGFSDPKTEITRRRDYGLSSDSIRHTLRMVGILSLPFGPGRSVFGNRSGMLSGLVSNWDLAAIFNAESGRPFSVNAADMFFGSSTGTGIPSGLVHPDVVSPLWRNPEGAYRPNGADGNSTYFGDPSPFALIRDPQCDLNVGRSATSDPAGFNLADACSLRALVLRVPAGTPGAFPLSGADPEPVLIMLQNPLPGSQGTLGGQSLRQPGHFALDASLSKKVMVRENLGIELRVDAINALNHVTPADVSINLGPGGSLQERSTAALAALATTGRQIQIGLSVFHSRR